MGPRQLFPVILVALARGPIVSPHGQETTVLFICLPPLHRKAPLHLHSMCKAVIVLVLPPLAFCVKA